MNGNTHKVQLLVTNESEVPNNLRYLLSMGNRIENNKHDYSRYIIHPLNISTKCSRIEQLKACVII